MPADIDREAPGQVDLKNVRIEVLQHAVGHEAALDDSAGRQSHGKWIHA